jgi:hypothetical protein
LQKPQKVVLLLFAQKRPKKAESSLSNRRIGRNSSFDRDHIALNECEKEGVARTVFLGLFGPMPMTPQIISGQLFGKISKVVILKKRESRFFELFLGFFQKKQD